MKPTPFLCLSLAVFLGSIFTAAAQPLVFGPYGPAGTYNAYQAVSTPLTWEAARTNATNQVVFGVRGHLATLASAGENGFVDSVGGYNYVWIGLTDNEAFGGFEEASPQTGAGFVWITGEPVTYSNWYPGEPNDSLGGEDGVHLYGFTSAWNDNGAGPVYGQRAEVFPSVIEYELGLPPSYFSTAPVWRIEVHKALPGVMISTLAAADALIAGVGRDYVVVSYYAQANMEDTGGPGDFGNNPGVAGVDNADDFAVRGTARLVVTAPGAYMFRANADDGQRLRIDLNNDGDFDDPGEAVIVDDVLSPPHNVDSPFIPLAAGTYRMEWTWFERDGGAEGELSVSVDGTTFYVLGDAAALGLGVVQAPDPARDKVSKWSQLPGYLLFTNMPNMRGGDRPSDFDWEHLMRLPGPGTNVPVISTMFDPSLISISTAITVTLAPDYAQVFVPEVPGFFEHVDLPLCRAQTNASDLLIQLVATSAGVPVSTGAPLASVIIGATNVADPIQWEQGPQWVGIDLRPFQVPVVPGQQYALVVRTVQPGAAGHYTWLARTGNPYPQGAAFTRNIPGQSWQLAPNGLDLGFCVIELTPDPTDHVIPPNWVIADDFRSDGRPILCVRWWGSYLKQNVTNRVEDGFVLSFFADLMPPGAFSRPGELLATYVAPYEAVRANNTHWRGWDGHEIWCYEVELKETCLAHSNSPIATARGFLEHSNVVYWLAIDAEVGHRIFPQTNQLGEVVSWFEQPSGHSASDYKHFWGWHTSPTNWNDASVMGNLFMPGMDWVYQDWMPNHPFHMELDQAFELLTTNFPPPPPPIPKVDKWSQLPGFLVFTNDPNMRGGDRASSFDWYRLMFGGSVLDQGFAGPPYTLSSGVGDEVHKAQTFTVGVAGTLSRVELYIQRERPLAEAEDLLFDIRPTAAGGAPVEPNAPVLASVTVPAASVPTTIGFFSIDVSGFGIAVTPGQVLALVLRTAGAIPGTHYGWDGSTSNPYPGGANYFRNTVFVPTWTLSGPGDDLSFRTYVDTGTGDVGEPAWVIADDFRSDGRPINCIRWWGSYLNGYTNSFEDGFVLSFFSDVPAGPTNTFSRPGNLLGTYFAPLSVLSATNTGYVGWDGYKIWSYTVSLADTCLEHAVANLARPTEFLERSNTIYWLAISAEVGNRPLRFRGEDGLLSCWSEPSGKSATNHFWGWHTSPTNWNDRSVMGVLRMEGMNWLYGDWMTNDLFHMERDMAFELLTFTNTPPPPPAPVVGPPALVGSNVVIRFSTVAGAAYFVEIAATLKAAGAGAGIQWQPISPEIRGTGGTAEFIHSGGASGSSRFYRVDARSPSSGTIVCGALEPIYFNPSANNQDVDVQATDSCPPVDSEVYVLDANGARVAGAAVNVPDGGTTPVTTFTVPPLGKVYFSCRGHEREGACTYTISVHR